MPDKTWDTLILGQGLAGSLLAYELIEDGQDICVIDQGHHTSSSKVAAGIINPIRGKRANRDIDFDHKIEKALGMYHGLEKHFSRSFAKPIKQLRIFESEHQQSLWTQAYQGSPYIQKIDPDRFPELYLPFGGCWIDNTHIIDVPAIIHSMRTWLLERGALFTQHMAYEDISIEHHLIQAGAFKAKRIIFCEGGLAKQNPFFESTDFDPAKGEILTLRLDQNHQHMLNWGKWLVRTKNATYKLGSSYGWHDMSLEPTPGVKEALLSELKKPFEHKGSPTIIEHQVGIRPTTKTRHNIVTQHSKYSNIFFFNGFGSTGCLNIPCAIDLLKNVLERP